MLKQLINIKMELWDVLWRKDKGAVRLEEDNAKVLDEILETSKSAG